MANQITTRAHPRVPTLGMSNGLSDLFFGAMLLSSSAFAQTAWQNGLALWFAEHDAGPWKGYGSFRAIRSFCTNSPTHFRTVHGGSLSYLQP
jgi:hypothetical protein